MKKIKLLGFVALVAVMLVGLTGCGKKMVHVDGTLDELMNKVYEGVSEDQMPRALGNTEITKDNMANYIGTDEVEIKEGIASESKVGSIAHSVVLLRVDENDDIESIKNTIKEKVNPNKWICVGVENVVVENKGDLIIVILNDEIGDTIKTNFMNL